MSILQSIGPARLAIVIVTFAASAASWTYRFIDEHMLWSQFWFYALVPTTFLWGVSILVGMYGLRIH